MALQIIYPSGAPHIFLKLVQTDDGWENAGSYQPKRLETTFVGKSATLEDQGLAQHFDAVYQGIRRANEDKLVRLQNPVLLLEHGLQIGNPPLGNLMSVMGLDVLFMAGESSNFLARVGGFFGLDTLLFPPEDFLHRQPETTVAHVLNDVFELRNIIAHGQEIPEKPYRELYSLRSTTGEQINQIDLYYLGVLRDASRFLLTSALRRVFTEGHYEHFANPKQWKAQLTLYEHRYKNANGTTVIKQRGR
jgi:hypothetical protein